MATRNVYLTDTDLSLIERMISSGRFQSAREVVRAGLRLLEQDQERREDLSEYMDLLLDETDNPLDIAGQIEEAAMNTSYDDLFETGDRPG